MNNIFAWAGTAVAVVAAYHLGASGVVPRTRGRLRCAAWTRIDRWLGRPSRHPARWTAEVISHASVILGAARSLTLHPIRTVRLVRQYRHLTPRRLPAELKDAVTEAARLHVPGREVTTARITVYRRERTFALNNVAFRHGRRRDEVTRVTLGGNPVYLGGPADPGIREQLDASRQRVARALAALPLGPDVTVISIPVLQH
ncbi:hypothetical protein [Streptomyces xiamenensis]|uniref:hypothetical protein n=1 Tax=Streptomyces xiamenensis TaxID=408015 RepID=UPI0035DAA794